MPFESGENADLNQYWYSKNTMEAFVKEIQGLTKVGAAFLSTPSLYFSLDNEDVKKNSKVFEYDRQWETDPGFVFYDYDKPSEVNITLFGQFDMVVIDPPFITEECWKKYAETARLLLCPGGKLICTTIVENEGLMASLLGCKPVKFQPSIPNLVYQYNTYTSYPEDVSVCFNEVNPEIAASDANPAKQIQRDLLESRDQFISQAQNRPGRGSEPAIDTSLANNTIWSTVPAGMTEYPEGGVPADVAPIDYGSEYNEMLEKRTKIGELSKALDSACKPLDKWWRSEQGLEKAKATNDTAKAEKMERDLQEAKDLHKRSLEELRTYKVLFPEETDGSVGGIVTAGIALFDRTSITQDEFKTIAPDVQMKMKSPLFQHQKTMLAKLKEIKKTAAKK
eukprot:TRINITY_DN4306_c0_g2_i2.p1 TRINITY_DN4306_c0_g2~~TRINITY_DN4306_c0_g2_i2.p1  ORF type:complete len:394 (+),score=85.61 TRINITY_DN4306_c0_g2_i2:35-1216(+)